MTPQKSIARSRHLRATVVVFLLSQFDRYLEGVEPEEGRRIMELFRKECEQAVRTHGGSIFSQQGASACGFFGASSLALSALLASERLLARWQALQAEQGGAEWPAINAAVHTDAFVLLDADTLLGSGMWLAHRFAEAGQGGVVLTSEATVEAVTASLPPSWRAERERREAPLEDENMVDMMVNDLLPLPDELQGRIVRIGPENGAAAPKPGGSVEFHYWMETPLRGIGGPSVPILRVLSDLHRPPAGAWSAEPSAPRPVQFGKYELLRKIGEGGMGTVWLARDRFGNRVAIKQLLQQINPNSTQLKRFRREAEVMMKLSHRNIARIHELGAVEGVEFFAMEYLEGASLAEVLSFSSGGPTALDIIVGSIEKARAAAPSKPPAQAALSNGETATGRPQTASTLQLASPNGTECDGAAEPERTEIELRAARPPRQERLIIPADQAVRLIIKACEAVQFAHEHGVLHRDLKPANIMLRGDGEPVVMDFGLAKQLGEERPGISLSVSGCIVGTLDYMAPEQATNSKGVSAQADVYSLGAILYEMLTGRKAFTATGDLAADLERLRHHVPTAPRSIVKAIDRDLEIITLKAMRPEVEQRYASAALLADDLRRYLAGEPIQARETTFRYLLQRRIRRNPAAFAAGAILGGILVISSLVFTYRIVAEGKRAERALQALKGTAPAFAAEAKALVDDGKFDEAIENIGHAIKLDPENLDYATFRGNILEATQRLSAAAEDYRRVLAGRPDAMARRNLRLCERLLAKAGPMGKLSRESQIELVSEMIKQRRQIEAAPLSGMLGQNGEAVESAIRIRLKEYASQVQWYDKRIERLPDSTFRIDLHQLQLGDLSKLQGLPISEIDLGFTSCSSVREIASLPLKRLSVDNTYVSDLEPLRHSAIWWLRISSTLVTDLSPLQGLPLERLDLAGCRNVSDLTPLRGAPLRHLFISSTGVRDLSPLADMPLEELAAAKCALNDLRPLHGAPLTTLSLVRTQGALDLGPLLTCTKLQTIGLPITPLSVGTLRYLPKLRVFDWDTRGVYQTTQFWLRFGPGIDHAHPAYRALTMAGAAKIPFGAIQAEPNGLLSLDLRELNIADAGPLKNLPIRSLNLAGTKVTDVSALRGKSLLVLRCDGTHIADVSPLADCKDLEQLTIPMGATGIDSLHELPKLKHLSFAWDGSLNRPADTVASFWAWRAKHLEATPPSMRGDSD